MAGYIPIDQSDIPESRHALFIRGFPADMPADRIRDFFNDQVGHCAFDFVKQSPDGTKLFVALRFDEKEAARDCMERFNETNVLGHRVSFQWYRDIRRYVSYHQKRGSFPPPPYPYRGGFPPYRGRGGFQRGYGNSSYPRRGGHYTRGRPPLLHHRTDFHKRPRTPSPKWRSRSPSRRRTPSNASTPRTRSIDRTPQSPQSDRASSERRSPSPPVMKKAKKQKKHKKRAREKSKTPEDVSDSDRRSFDSKRPREDMKDEDDRYTPPSPILDSPVANNSNNQENTLESRRLELIRKGAPNVVSTVSKVVNIEDDSQVMQLNQLSIRMKLLPESLQDVPLSPSAASSSVTESRGSADRQVVLLTPSSSPDASRQPASIVVKKEIRNARNPNPTQLFLTNMKAIQNTIISDIESEVEEIRKNAPPVKKESGLKLSSVTKQGLVEAQRKQKIAILSPAQVQLVNAKQKDMDKSYEMYCDTFTSVLKILTDNDPDLAAQTEPAKNSVLAEHKRQLSEELDEFIELLMQS